jgi:crotonobetainyl-CoA:carnitine CoA-transferase CaiB-like acyl-CoA transferase
MFALDGVDVLTFENGISAPLCTRLLGDLGAEVIKVERPGVGDVNRHWDSVVHGDSSAHLWVDRNKRSVELDLKSEEGQQLARELAERADVVVQNFSPGVVERLGIGYDDVAARNEDVIYLNISGYGRTGPYRDRRAYDLVMQGETGLVLMTGSPDQPAKIPLSVCDINAGMYGTMSVLTALFHRERTGDGQQIDVDMFSGMLSWLGYFPFKYWYAGETPERVGMRHHLLTPYGPFRTADDRYVNFAILSESHWETFCESVVECPEWADDERFETNEKRVDNREALEPRIEEIFATRTRDEWVEKLDRHGIPWGDVNTIEEVLSHPVVEERDLVAEMETDDGPVKVIDNPMGFHALDVRHEPTPDLGEDTDAVLGDLGLSDEEIDRLRRDDVV